MIGKLISHCAIVALLIVVQDASGQQDLKVVEANVGDLGPLSLSLRSLQLDLRQPTNFDRVYRAPGQDGLLMRINGGLYAVFDRSLYAPSKQGLMPLIPGGTVFYIGRPSFLDDVEPALVESNTGLLDPQSHTNHLQTRNEMGVRPASSVSSITSGPLLHRSSGRRAGAKTTGRGVPATIINNPDYRAARIRQLMKKAVTNVKARNG